jgi:hypothetical protein
MPIVVANPGSTHDCVPYYRHELAGANPLSTPAENANWGRSRGVCR